MKRIAIVNQRYGLDVNGGSELYARLIAEHLSKYFEIEVLTTTAQDYVTWENHYPEGVEKDGALTIRRFKVEHPRNAKRFRFINLINRALGFTPFNIDKTWIDEQGPYAPKLIDYIESHESEYDVFIFVTYLYYSTAMGLPKVAKKAVLIPTAHDEPPVYFRYYRQIFQTPKAIVYLTDEEKEFVEKTFHNSDIPNTVAAVGIDAPSHMSEEGIKAFQKENGIDSDYIIYAGRVDGGKGCDEMFDFFIRYKASHPKDERKLVVIGKAAMEIPKRDDIPYLGFVTDEEKYLAIAGASVLWLPSKFESLSIALLEGFDLGVPALVNGKCEVLKGHAKKSGAAFAYSNYEEFEKGFATLEDKDSDTYRTMQKKAIDYIKRDYRWDVIEKKLCELLNL